MDSKRCFFDEGGHNLYHLQWWSLIGSEKKLGISSVVIGSQGANFGLLQFSTASVTNMSSGGQRISYNEQLTTDCRFWPRFSASSFNFPLWALKAERTQVKKPCRSCVKVKVKDSERNHLRIRRDSKVKQTSAIKRLEGQKKVIQRLSIAEK